MNYEGKLGELILPRTSCLSLIGRIVNSYRIRKKIWKNMLAEYFNSISSSASGVFCIKKQFCIRNKSAFISNIHVRETWPMTSR
jgi:hypothetical protein